MSAKCEPGLVVSHVSPFGTIMRSRLGLVVLSLATAAACRWAYGVVPPVVFAACGLGEAAFDASDSEAGLGEWISSPRLSALRAGTWGGDGVWSSARARTS